MQQKIRSDRLRTISPDPLSKMYWAYELTVWTFPFEIIDDKAFATLFISR